MSRVLTSIGLVLVGAAVTVVPPRAHEVPPEQAVRMFVPPEGPERVDLDPDRSAAVRDFASRGLRALAERGDWLLFLVCLALRPGPEKRAAVAALAIGQAAALPAGAVWDLSPDARVALELAAASCLVMAGLHTIAGASSRWSVPSSRHRQRQLWPLALLFGMLAGLVFGQGFHGVAVFAGSHAVAALLAFGTVVAAAELWVMAVLSSSVSLAYRGGPVNPIVTVVVSIVVSHTAVHWMMDRADELAGGGTVTAEHAIGILALGWAGLMLGAALLNTVLAGRRHGPGDLAGTGSHPIP